MGSAVGVGVVSSSSLRALGATGDIAQDATGYVQAAADLVTKGSGVPAVAIDATAGTYRITSTVLLDGIAPKITGDGTGNPTDHRNPGKGTTFVWDGPAGQPMFRVRNCQNFVMEDVLLLGHDDRPPSELIYFENDGAAGQWGTNQQISLSRVTLGRYGYAGVTYPGHSRVDRCVRFGGVNVNNDQAWFYDCQFGGASDALVVFDNSNTLWCSFINPLFDGRAMSDMVTPAAVGLRTNACVVLFNPQFNRCSTDIDVQNGTAYVYMWNSENSARFARVAGQGGLVVHGGAMVAHDTMGANMFDATTLGSDGALSLTDVRFRTGLANWPKIRVRGGTSTLAGRLVVRDCGLPEDVYDVQAHATGIGGVIVRIDDGDSFLRAHLFAGETLGRPTTMPLRVGGYVEDGSAVADLLDKLAAAGFIRNATQQVKTPRVNALVNPLFASSAAGWTKHAKVTTTADAGAVHLTAGADISAGSLIYNASAAPASAGELWSAGVTVAVDGATRQRLRLGLHSYPSQTLCGSQLAWFSPGETKRLYVDGATVPAGDSSVRLSLGVVGSALLAGATVTARGPTLEMAPVSGGE
jgi:hypothetical protein